MSTSSEFITTETRHQKLRRQGEARPRFLQRVYPFAVRSVHELIPLHQVPHDVVPQACHSEVIYFRAGNLSDDLIYLRLMVDGKATQYVPIGPKADFHVSLAILESHSRGACLELGIATTRGLSGTVVVDMAIVEIQDSA